VNVTIGRVERVERGENEDIAVFDPKPALLVTEISGERVKEFIPSLVRVIRVLIDNDESALAVIVALLLADDEESTVCVESGNVGVTLVQPVPLDFNESEDIVEIDGDNVDVRVERKESLLIPPIVFRELREMLTDGEELELTTLDAEIVVELHALTLDERDAGTFVKDASVEAVIVAVVEELTLFV
jgi:hypothetical protein